MHHYDCGHKATGYGRAVWTTGNRVVCTECAATTERHLLVAAHPRECFNTTVGAWCIWPYDPAIGHRTFHGTREAVYPLMVA